MKMESAIIEQFVPKRLQLQRPVEVAAFPQNSHHLSKYGESTMSIPGSQLSGIYQGSH